MAEAELAVLRDQLRDLLPDWQILSATLAAPYALQAALDLAGPDPLIYPHFMTDGWFTKTALPGRIAPVKARMLPPFGVDPGLPGLAVRWLTQELAQKGWAASETCLIVAGHGSGRSRNAARDTQAFANAVQARMGFGDLRLGYIEEPPYLGDAVVNAGERAICLPFFAARRGHVLDDLPEALDQADFTGLRLDPIGLHPEVPNLIAAVLGKAQLVHSAPA